MIATSKKILTSDEFVLSEFKKLQILFSLKREFRYGEERTETIHTESVAEHVYGMFCLNEYFLPLENSDDTFDQIRINKMILLHDIDEIETGDKIGYLKTDADRVLERGAQDRVVANLPQSMQSSVKLLLDEYDTQETIEAQYVRALDKIEPLFHLYNENGKELLLKNGTTRANSHSIKDKYVAPFPYIKRFNEVMNGTMDKEGFFAPSA